MKYSSWWGFRQRTIIHFFASTHFIASWRRDLYFKWLVERWPEEQYADSGQLDHVLRSRSWGQRRLWTENVWNLFRPRVLAVFFLCQGVVWASLWSGYHVPVIVLEGARPAQAFFSFENVNFRKFHGIFKLARVQTTETYEFSSLAKGRGRRGAWMKFTPAIFFMSFSKRRKVGCRV